MKNQRIRVIPALLTMIFLTTAFVCFGSVSASAQTLDPGEIIYSRVSTSPNGSCNTAAVWVVGQDGSNDRFITFGLHPRISPDGRLILFKRFDPNSLCSPFFNDAPQWWIRDLTTQQESRISNNFRIAFGHTFVPNNNGGSSQIMLDDTGTICTMSLDGTSKVCSTSLLPVRFAVHPSVRGGDNLVVAADYDSNFRSTAGLYTLSFDLSNRQKIANTSYGDLSPSWSNDGQIIAYAKFANNRGANYPYYFDNLYKIKPDGTDAAQLTFLNNLPFTEGFGYSFVWTTDNSTILNAARINGVAGIYKISANGGGILGTIPITAGAIPDWVGGIVPTGTGGGGNYSLLQSVIANGGETSSSSDYSMTATIGEAVAGVNSTGGVYDLGSGFWGGRTKQSADAKHII